MKNKTFTAKKSGFSLIELSIVLIIIGLLVAAITGGASLVKSAELRAVMAEARGYQVAVNSFYSQFDALPGDYNIAIGILPTTPSGSDAPTTGNNDKKLTFNNENGTAWLQLRNSAIIDANVIPVVKTSVSTALAVGTSMPASKLKSAGWAFDYISESTNPADAATKVSMNAIILTGATTSTSATPTLDAAEGLTGGVDVNNANVASTAAITTVDALSIDTKVDDGKANSGSVIGINSRATVAAAATAGVGIAGTSCQDIATFTANTATSSSSSYRTVYTAAPACALAFRVDPNA